MTRTAIGLSMVVLCGLATTWVCPVYQVAQEVRAEATSSGPLVCTDAAGDDAGRQEQRPDGFHTANGGPQDGRDASAIGLTAAEGPAEAGEETLTAQGSTPPEEHSKQLEAQAHSEPTHGTSHEAAEHHDPYDLTHANASSTLGDAAELRFDHVLASWVVFLLLLVIVGKLAWKPIIQGLEKREKAIAEKIEEAERNAQAAAERLQEYERRLAQAAEESRALLAKAQQEAERRSAELIAAAQQAAERERLRAMAEIDAARAAALEQIGQRAADLAVMMASRVLHRQLTGEDQRQLIAEALQQFRPHQ